MKIQILFSLFILSFFSLSLCAQDSQIDSLKIVIEQSPPDTSKVNTMLALSGKLCRTNPLEAISIASDARDLAGQIEYQKGQAFALKSIGMAYYFQGDYTNVLVFWQQSMEKFEMIGDKLGVANMLNNLGAVYFNGGDDNKAVGYYIQSLRVSEQIGDTLRIATALVNIGAVYYNKEATHSRALEYYKRALPLSEALGDNDAIGTTAVNMGEIYFERDDTDSALMYFEQSLEAYRKSETGNVQYTLNNIGKVYAKKGDKDQAIKYQKEALRIATERKAKLEIAQALIGMAETYLIFGDIQSSIKYFKQAEPIAEEINVSAELSKIYGGLAYNYETVSDFKKAFEYHTAYERIKETLYNAEMDKRITAATLSYDIEKKQGQIDLITKEKELHELTIQKQKFTRNALIVGIVLVLVIAFITFRNYLNKVKINKILDKQKAQIENLLLNILPAKVAEELQLKGKATPRDYESVTVLFTDFKGFTKIAEGLTPNDLVAELNTFFQAFDSIVDKYQLEKIKTIGDAYMCAGGIPTETDDHFFKTVEVGLEMQNFMMNENEKRKQQGLIPWELRVGIHTGPVVAGVVGKKKYAYDIWGNTVNIASRMESNGEAGKVNISDATFQLIKERFKCHHRGKISAKNVGEIDMYFIEHEIIN